MGRDQSEGVALKNMDGVCARTPNLYCEVLVLSMDVRVWVVSEERLMDEVLGLGEHEMSSALLSAVAAVKWPSTPGRLNFQVDVEEESIEASEGASRVVRGLNKDDVTLGARLLREIREGRGKIEEGLGLGLSSRADAPEEDEIRRFWVRLRANVRNGEGVVKVMVLPRLLRGVEGALERSMTCCALCALHETRFVLHEKRVTVTDDMSTYLCDVRVRQIDVLVD